MFREPPDLTIYLTCSMTKAISFLVFRAIFPPPLFANTACHHQGLNVVQRSASGEQSARTRLQHYVASHCPPRRHYLPSAYCSLAAMVEPAPTCACSHRHVWNLLLSLVCLFFSDGGRWGLARSVPHRRYKLVLCRKEIWTQRLDGSRQTGTDLFRTFAMLFLLLSLTFFSTVAFHGHSALMASCRSSSVMCQVSVGVSHREVAPHWRKTVQQPCRRAVASASFAVGSDVVDVAVIVVVCEKFLLPCFLLCTERICTPPGLPHLPQNQKVPPNDCLELLHLHLEKFPLEFFSFFLAGQSLA